MLSRRTLWALLTCVAPFAAFAREPLTRELTSFDLPGYTMLAPDADMARSVATLLSQADRVLAKLLEHEPHTTTVPTTVVVLSPADLDRYFGGRHAFMTAPYQSFSNVILVRVDSDPDELRIAVFHQAAHNFLRTQFNAEIPLWFSEGLALFMAPNEVEDTRVVLGEQRFEFGTAADERVQRNEPGPEENVRQGHARVDWYDTGALLAARADSRLLSTSENSYFMRGQCWLMAHKAFVDDEKFRESIFKYLDAVNSFTPIDKAVRKTFGLSVAELDRVVYGYSRRTDFALTTITLAPVPPVTPGEGTPIPAATLFENLASLALDSGAELKHIDELVTAAEKQGLDATRVQLLKLRLAAQQRDDAGVESVLGELKDHLTDAAVARSAAIALFERDADTSDRKAASSPAAVERLSAAQDLLGRVLADQRADAQAAWIYGVIAARLSRDVDGALRHLERARNSQPENPDVAAALAALHSLRNDRETMIARLKDTLRYSRSPDQRRWAARQIAATTANLKSSGEK